MLSLNSRPVPRRVGCFMYTPKVKISSWITVNNFEVVYGPKIYLGKIPRQSVHKWTSTSTLKFIIPCNITIKWRMMFLPTPCSIYAELSCKRNFHFRFDGTEDIVLWWLVGWAEITYFFIKFETSQTLDEFRWNIVKKENCPNFS